MRLRPADIIPTHLATKSLSATYAYGPAEGLPDTKGGMFTQDLYDEAKKDGWLKHLQTYVDFPRL